MSALSPFIRFWNNLTALQAAAVISALVLTIGAVVEYWYKLKILAVLALKWILRRSTPFDRCTFNKLFIHAIGPILVVLGIAGEVVFEGRTFVVEDTQAEQARKIVGSLEEQAGQADEKAKKAIVDSSTALDQANDALRKAGKAQESLGKAEDEASKAETSASNALTLARGARQEADSFETDIKGAKQQAADAESHLAEALRQTAAATEELNRLKTSRSFKSRTIGTNIFCGEIVRRNTIRHVDKFGFRFRSTLGVDRSDASRRWMEVQYSGKHDFIRSK